ncbi:Tyrosyl-DNA phosphodiesterase [Geosmithia morbida]|uniref:Tyrosyl-DNA phosphodiesterase n=1 Tax=Geosmithia morbida TaxID=1094350 RepID=A0A9P5CYD5_9HYPO|nr:Tyrosyl-DNA phosphodiesterase [Geosmithia morbida]KAF4120288.1 Tyrosyl-DNA phosphodiesterase [Geosmithia morbida]
MAGQDVPELSSDADDDEALRYAIALSLQDEQGAPQDAPDKSKVTEISEDKKSTGDLPGANTTTFGSLFRDGAVKKTWAYGYPRTEDDIKIEEVLQRDQLELAVLSSFQWDDEWLMSKVDMLRTRLLLVAYAADQDQKTAMQANAPPNVRFCFPPMSGRGAMHSKLQLLKYPGSLRIVVPTGNLVSYDWGETGVMENVGLISSPGLHLLMVFLIDLPLLSETSHKNREQQQQQQPTGFFTELSRFLRAAGIDDNMIQSLSRYDFTRTANLGFVYTIVVGYCGLGDTVAVLGLATSTGAVDVDIVAASLGSINRDLIGAIYNACQGDNGMKEYNERTSRKRGQKMPADVLPQQLQDHVRIYFPAETTVAKSRGGRGAAGTICVHARWWRSPSFPTGLVRDCENVRDGLLLHSKMMFVRPSSSSSSSSFFSADPGPTSDDGAGGGSGTNSASSGGKKAWAYVGSANLSESAWTRLDEHVYKRWCAGAGACADESPWKTIWAG